MTEGTNSVHHEFHNSGSYIVSMTVERSSEEEKCIHTISSFVTGIEDVVNEDQIKLYPNPTKDIINIVFANKLTKDITIKLYNIWGQPIKKQFIHQESREITLNVKGLVDGIYLIELTTDERLIYREKLIKN